jgi:hypothetical protein
MLSWRWRWRILNLSTWFVQLARDFLIYGILSSFNRTTSKGIQLYSLRYISSFTWAIQLCCTCSCTSKPIYFRLSRLINWLLLLLYLSCNDSILLDFNLILELLVHVLSSSSSSRPTILVSHSLNLRWFTSFLLYDLLGLSICTSVLRNFTQILNILGINSTCIRIISVYNVINIWWEWFSISINVLSWSSWAASLLRIGKWSWCLLQSLIQLDLLRIKSLLNLSLMDYLYFLRFSSVLNLILLWHRLLLLLHLLSVILLCYVIIQYFNRWILNEEVINVIVINDVCYIRLNLLHLTRCLYKLLLSIHLSCYLVNSSLFI